MPKLSLSAVFVVWTGLTAALCPQFTSARASVIPNGSFGYIPFGTTTATTSGTWDIGPNTLSVTVPANEMVNTTTRGSIYLGNPDTLDIMSLAPVTLSSDIFSISGLNTNESLATSLIVTVHNSSNDELSYTFDHLFATSSGNGNLALYWSGNLTSDTDGLYALGPASMSAAFTASDPSAVGNVSFSVAIPPAAPPSPPLPEPASLALLASGMVGLGLLRRRPASRKQ